MDGAMWLPEFDHEFAETRKALALVPDDRLDYRPHEKSWTLRELAGHVAEIPHWVGVTLNTDTFDLDEGYERVIPKDRAGMLERFDEGVAEARGALEGAAAATLMETWRMVQNGEPILEMPKGVVLRNFVFNHNVHHRAQLGVYLRLLDLPVPGHYGPSADEMESRAED